MIYLQLILAVVLMTLWYAAHDKFINRQQIEWGPNIGVSYVFCILWFPYMVQGGEILFPLLIGSVAFLVGWGIYWVKKELKSLQLSQITQNNAPAEAPKPETSPKTKHSRVWDGI